MMKIQFKKLFAGILFAGMFFFASGITSPVTAQKKETVKMNSEVNAQFQKNLKLIEAFKQTTDMHKSYDILQQLQNGVRAEIGIHKQLSADNYHSGYKADAKKHMEKLNQLVKIYDQLVVVNRKSDKLDKKKAAKILTDYVHLH